MALLALFVRESAKVPKLPKQIFTIMAHYVPQAGIDNITGALSKRHSQPRLSITRRKPVKDPLTGEVVGYGPKEMFMQNKRNYKRHPRTEGEKKQLSRWTFACQEAPKIYKDPSHPRFMELYHRWKSQLSDTEPCKDFPRFVRSVLAQE